MHYAELRQVRSELTGPGGDFEIVEADILGQRIRTYKNAVPSLREFWLSTARFSDRTYLVYEDERLTYADVHARANAFAAWLRKQGVIQGDRVAIAMRNYPEWLIAYWACVSSGITVVGMNAWWVADEMLYALEDAAPKVLILDAERLARLQELHAGSCTARPVGVRLPEVPGDVVPWSEAVAAPAEMPEAVIDPDSDACIFYTSGTTGFPKGAQLTHRGCVANIEGMAFNAAAMALTLERATGLVPPASPFVPVILIATPLFHVSANNCGAHLATTSGGTIVLMYRWDADEALRLIEREKVTGSSCVPAMSRELINHPDLARTDTSSLISLGGGGAQLPPDLVHRIDGELETSRAASGYGMTEVCGVISLISGDFFADRSDSAGPALPNLETKCVDDDGKFVPPGEPGELWVRGSSVIKGYINRPEATAEAITDGWLHTGDVARIDEDGFIYIVDRKKDLVIRGGENVSCTEVEAGIYRHTAVAECSVFSVPDKRLGEEVGAAIVLRDGTQLDAEALQAHCAEHMARHKVPRYVWFMAEPLPRNASGKFLRRELQARFTKELEGSR